MEGFLYEKQELEKTIICKDAEIEELKKEKQDFMSKVKELEAELDILRKFAIHKISSSLEKKEPPPSVRCKLPARPSPPEKKQQPTSILANLPARPAFMGFGTLGGTPAPQPSLFAPTASPQMLHPRPTPIFNGIEPTLESTLPQSLPTRLRGRPKGTVPFLLPHRQSFSTNQMPSGASATPTAPATKVRSYFHGETFHYIPVPQNVPLPPVPRCPPSSFDFNQQTGNTWEKRVSAPPSTGLNFQPPPAGITSGLPPSKPGPAKFPSSGPNSLFGAYPPSSASSTGIKARPSLLFGISSGSNALSTRTSRGRIPLNPGIAKAPASSQGPLFGHLTLQQSYASQPPTESGLTAGFMPRESGTTKASSLHQGSTFQDSGPPSPSPLLLEINQPSGKESLDRTVNEAAFYFVGNESEDEEWPVAQQSPGTSRWR